MNQLKFSLAVVFNILTAITFGYVCFLGANFYTLGDKKESIILAIIITSLLIGTSLGAKILKQTKRNFKTCFVWEMILLVLFTVVISCATYYPFSHYFVVSAQENVIKNKLIDNITQAQNMYPEYEAYVKKRETKFIKKLTDAVNQKAMYPHVYNDYGLKDNISVTPVQQIEFKHNTLKELLLPKEEFDKDKAIDSTWLADAGKSVENWEPISLVDVINNIQTNTTKSLTRLILLAENEAQNENHESFTPSSISPNNVNNYFITHGSPSPFSIVLAIVSYILMLLSWYIIKRDTRGIGALKTAEYEVIL